MTLLEFWGLALVLMLLFCWLLLFRYLREISANIARMAEALSKQNKGR